MDLIKDMGALEEKVVILGMEEALKILRCMLNSTIVLTDIFMKKLCVCTLHCSLDVPSSQIDYQLQVVTMEKKVDTQSQQAYNLHRSPYFWDNPDDFEPKRFQSPKEQPSTPKIGCGAD